MLYFTYYFITLNFIFITLMLEVAVDHFYGTYAASTFLQVGGYFGTSPGTINKRKMVRLLYP